jgi:DNA-binding MarR family transcriptional regulator
VKRILSRDEELEIAICYLARIPIKDICDHFDISRSGVHRVITRLGIETERGKKSA